MECLILVETLKMEPQTIFNEIIDFRYVARQLPGWELSEVRAGALGLPRAPKVKATQFDIAGYIGPITKLHFGLGL